MFYDAQFLFFFLILINELSDVLYFIDKNRYNKEVGYIFLAWYCYL